MLIWKRQEPGFRGLFAYKVYGSFSDVTAEDFLQVQIDVDYRKEWDPTAQELQVIETDPESESSTNQSTDIIHWEMIWPVSNRTQWLHSNDTTIYFNHDIFTLVGATIVFSIDKL